MNYLSVCSGIEAASVAWSPLGFNPVAFSEIEQFPSAVLSTHYPNVPNLGDMLKFHEWPDFKIGLLAGGTPCQAFSVAGLREGLNDPRGNLTLTFLGVAARYMPRWIVWENVPGVLSDRTNAFGQFLAGLAQLGYGWAYRVLDAQYFGLAQRRKRVFVVACLGDWASAAAVLFERESLLGHSAPSRKAREEITGTFGSRTSAGGGFGTDFDLGGGLRVAELAPTLNAHFGDKQGLENQHIDGGVASLSRCLNAGGMGRLDYETETLIPTRRGGFFDDATHTLRGSAFDASEDGTGRGTPLTVAFDTTQITSKTNRCQPQPGDPCHPLAAGAHPPAIAFTCKDSGGDGIGCGAVHVNMAVRRMTPRECERLQGFPDNYTDIIYKNKPAKDGPRYKVLGNSMAVPCMPWIGRRIQMVEARKWANPDFA